MLYNNASRTEYDAFGDQNNVTYPSDMRGDFVYAGKHGYVTDRNSGMQLLDSDAHEHAHDLVR
jgi:hypothetical protein